MLLNMTIRRTLVNFARVVGVSCGQGNQIAEGGDIGAGAEGCKLLGVWSEAGF